LFFCACFQNSTTENSIKLWDIGSDTAESLVEIPNVHPCKINCVTISDYDDVFTGYFLFSYAIFMFLFFFLTRSNDKSIKTITKMVGGGYSLIPIEVIRHKFPVTSIASLGASLFFASSNAEEGEHHIHWRII
jgi:hypothetical protein